ncbi:TetR/AcrR family transcriptional regulator [Nocardioides solisilvae]|uniref:TetR/AcrR family transcriptional regulator n=1 Tax=Nocardioides solisilvae TaxID=1542435 RepID=UPI0013A532F4|nr:TetR/AcrR family transcriptional regulator [Nocardioides solisilvae]
MGRRREHDLDEVLDHARTLWAREGRGALTIRALSAASGMSNGAIYHAFGSRDGLLALTWAREARRFVERQRAGVARALDEGGGPVEALVVAATAPAAHARHDEEGARLLLSVRPRDLTTDALTPAQQQELAQLRHDLDRLVRQLAALLWQRQDRAALVTVRCCLVELPSALLLRPRRVTDPLARLVLERAVRGVVTGPPPFP